MLKTVHESMSFSGEDGGHDHGGSSAPIASEHVQNRAAAPVSRLHLQLC